MSSAINGSAIDKLLSNAVASGAVPHVAAIAADWDGIIYEGAAGPRVTGAGSDPVTTSTAFRIMSMTKMVAMAAALRQVERGELDLDAPVDTYLPEFAGVQVLEGFDGDTPRLRAPASRATVKHLVTHTSGLGYWFWNEELARYQQVTGIPNPLTGKADAFKAPMLFDPGTRFNYGISFDWLGKVIEAVSGKGLDVVVKEDITGPLGMNDTMFSPDSARGDSAVAVHVKNEAGQWTPADPVANFDSPDWWSAGHGLSATPRDYIRFERMLLSGGELDGERILRQETVDAAFRNQIGNLGFPADIPTADPALTGPLRLGPGGKWGHGLLLNPAYIPNLRGAWSGGWAGVLNTYFWVDRTSGICASIYTNSLPFLATDALKLYVGFEAALYAAL
jgi:CubicO group peptidase (beta-lactamase class C family)